MIGVPDAYHGEVVKACVVLKSGAAVTPAELIAHCRRDLAPYKVPHQVEVRDTLPMSAVGKILYRVLRDEVAAAAQRLLMSTDHGAHSALAHRRELSGLEFFKRMMAGEIPPPPMVSLLGLRLVEADEGRVVFAGTAGEAFYNGMGVAHGGWAATHARFGARLRDQHAACRPAARSPRSN